MRERVEPRGGTLDAGPRPDGGFEVRAAIPRVIRVFIADDQSLVRDGLKLVVDSQQDMTVVGEASDGREALEALAVTTADVVLMDVRMPRLDGVAATARLIQRPTRRACSCSPPSTSTNTCSPPCARALPASCSRTPSRRSCWRRSARSTAATRSSRPARPGACWTRSSLPARDQTDPRSETLTERERDVLLTPSPAARPTPRSAPSCSWPRRRSRPTSAGCCPSSTRATASSS